MYIDTKTNEILSESDIRERAAPIGLKSAEFWDAEFLSDYEVTLVEYIETPQPEAGQWQTVSPGPLDKSEPGIWRTTWVVTEPTLEQAIERKLEELADSRWVYQNSGVTVAGASIASDNATALYVDTTLTKMQSDPDLVLTWKTASGDFVQLNQTALQSVADALFAHVQNAFQAESDLVDSVNAIANDSELTDAEKLKAIMAVEWLNP